MKNTVVGATSATAGIATATWRSLLTGERTRFMLLVRRQRFGRLTFSPADQVGRSLASA